MHSLRLAIMSALLITAIACGGETTVTPTTPSPAPEPSPAPAPAPAPSPAPEPSPAPAPAPEPTPTPAPTPAPMPQIPSASVTIPRGAESLGNRAYSPDQVNVSVGGMVTWTNTDSISHTSTSDAN